jgi:hypothetical protein
MKHSPIKDLRHRCRFCGTKTWEKDYNAFMGCHDRNDGKVCRRAQKEPFAKVSKTWEEEAKEAAKQFKKSMKDPDFSADIIRLYGEQYLYKKA